MIRTIRRVNVNLAGIINAGIMSNYVLKRKKNLRAS